MEKEDLKIQSRKGCKPPWMLISPLKYYFHISWIWTRLNYLSLWWAVSSEYQRLAKFRLVAEEEACLLTSLLLSRGSVLCFFSVFLFLSAHTSEEFLLSVPSYQSDSLSLQYMLVLPVSKGKIIPALRQSFHCWRKRISCLPFCPRFPTLSKGSLLLHSVATSELLSGKNEFPVSYYLIR